MDASETDCDIIYQRIVPGTSEKEMLPDPFCKPVKTRAYYSVKRALDDEGRALVCGSPGSGKSYMSLMLQKKYEKDGYETVKVRNTNNFSFDTDIETSSKTFLVFDDFFGRFAQTDSVEVSCFQILEDIDTFFKRVRIQEERSAAKQKMSDGPKLKVLFNSRTDIYIETKPMLKRFSTTLLRPTNIINLNDKNHCLTADERKRILKKHLEHRNVTNLDEKTIDDIAKLDFKTLGFPYICQMFVNIKTSKIDALKFFNDPIQYVDEEILMMLEKQPTKAAVLLLLALNDGDLQLTSLTNLDDTANLTSLPKLDQIIKDLPRNCLPNYLTTAAKTMIGSYLDCEEDSLRFIHPTLYNAVCYSFGGRNPNFVLENFSLQFIVERVVFKKDIHMSGRDDFKRHIVIGKSYVPKLVERLVREIEKRHIGLSLSHRALLDSDVFNIFVSCLKVPQVIHATDKDSGFSFCFWASYSRIWKKGFLEQLGHPCLEENERLEASLSSCMVGNEDSFKELISYGENFKQELFSTTLSQITNNARERMLTLKKSNQGRGSVSKRHDTEKDRLIHVASGNGHANIVQLMLDIGQDINDTGGLGMTPLMYGSYFGHFHLVKLLLDEGANTELKNDDGDNCLHLAARGGFRDIVELLLETKLEPNCRGRFDRTPLMYAAFDGHVNIIKLFIERKVDLQPKPTTINKNNCLHEGCMKGRIDVAEILLNAGKMDIEMKGERDRTPLLAASRGGHCQLVEYLISKQADKTATDSDGNTCFHLAAVSGSSETIELLSSFVDINALNIKKQTPLMCYLYCGHSDAVTTFLEKGAKLDKKDKYNQTCLHYSAKAGCVSLLKTLKEKGTLKDVPGFAKRTPLLQACLSGAEDSFIYLKENGASLTSTDQYNATSLHMACRASNIRIVRELLSVKELQINTCDNLKNTPLSYAIQADNTEIVDLLKQNGADAEDVFVMHRAARDGSKKVIQAYLARGVDPDLRGKNNKTPLMEACGFGYLDVVELLLNVKPSQLHDTDDLGRSLGHFACQSNNLNVLEFLIKRGADIQAVCNRNYSLLHTAAFNGSVKMASFLIEQGISTNIRDDLDKTPLMAAFGQRRDNSEVVTMLMSKGADVNVVSTTGDTLLHAAAEFRADTVTVASLLDLVNLDVNKTNESGNTPIMVAARHGNLKMVQFLLNRGGSVFVTNNEGQSAIHLACMNEHVSTAMIQTLIERGGDPKSADSKGKIPEDYIVDITLKERIKAILMGSGVSREKKLGKRRNKHRKN